MRRLIGSVVTVLRHDATAWLLAGLVVGIAASAIGYVWWLTGAMR